jgi:hypothetical protein
MLRVVLGLGIVALSASVVLAACDPLEGIGFNKGCDGDTPFCSRTSEPTATTPEYNCVACRTNCDCLKVDEYCSVEYGSDYGTCTQFPTDLINKECYPYSGPQLRNKDFDEDKKCAVLFSYTPNGATNSTLVVNVEGACIMQKCQYCDFRGNNGECDNMDGLGPERECVYPGALVDTHSANWSPGKYYENPQNVWWAIFFTFFILLLCCQCAQTVKMFMGGE